ncbi:MAG: putative ABC transporter permease [Treponema sp.]|nr:putative ABC transporter permease [Treponema sp.]
MKFFLVITFLFFAGSLIGWGIELFFRRFFSKNNTERKWINPGFLMGPYLPLYGFSLVILFLLSYIDVSFISNPHLQKLVLFGLMALCITFFEYIAGMIFIVGMKIRLWDYSKNWGNIKGIICPQFTFYWWLLSAIYYFIIHPKILSWLFWFTNHIEFSFVVGFFYGVLCADLTYSLRIMTRIRHFARENKIIIQLAELQQHIRLWNEENKEKLHFWLTMKSEQISLPEHLRLIFEKLQKK